MRWLFLVFCVFFCVCYSSNDCTYTKNSKMTIYGTTMPTSGQASAAAGEDCAAQCCNMAGCYATSWTIVSAQCWFFDNNTIQTHKPTPLDGVDLWMLNSKTPCTTNCTKNVTGDKKRGLGYNFSSKNDLSAIKRGANWWYNWGSIPNSPEITKASQDLGLEFVPMIWNDNFDVNDVISKIPSGTKYILGFNEPNFFHQGNLSATQAASLWPKIERIAKAKNLQIVSPAVNYCGPVSNCWETDPFKYLDEFFTACNNCRIDFVAAHWYSCSGQSLNHYIGGFRKYNKTLWLTEFSCVDSTEDQQYQYMKQALSILDADNFVFRYAWFSGRSDLVAHADLLGGDGVVTRLGEVYITQNLEGRNGSGSGRYSSRFLIGYLFLVIVITW